jgi:hypothetical protein
MDQIPSNFNSDIDTASVSGSPSSEMQLSQNNSRGDLLGIEVTLDPSPPLHRPLENLAIESSSSGIPLSASRISLVTTSSTGVTSNATMDSSPSPSEASKEKLSLERVDQIKTLLQEKIKDAREVRFSTTRPFLAERREGQRRYIQHLERTLEVINEIPSFIDEEASDNMDEKISETVSTILELAAAIQDETDELYDGGVALEQAVSTHGIGEAREAILHFIDYLEDLKTNDVEKSLENFCLARKCMVAFQKIKAFDEGKKDVAALYHRSAWFYTQAREAIATEQKEFNDLEQAAELLMFAGNALNDEKLELSELYRKAGNCFFEAAQRSQFIQNGTNVPSEIKECELLRDAGTNFKNAAIIAKKATTQEGARILKQLGTIQSHQAEAIISKKQGAYHYFGEAGKLMQDMFDEMRRDQQKAGLLLNAAYYADCVGEVLLGENFRSINYQEAFDLQKQAIEEQSKGKKGVAELFAEAAACSFKVTWAQRTVATPSSSKYDKMRYSATKLIWARAATSYLSMIERQDQGGSTSNDPVVLLFKTAAKYNKIAAEEIEDDLELDEGTTTSLKEASLHFLLAAEKLQQGNTELSDAYHDYAKSHYLLAVIRTPKLYQHLSEPEKAILGNKEPVPNEGLIQYWEKIVFDHHQKIQQLQRGPAVTK